MVKRAVNGWKWPMVWAVQRFSNACVRLVIGNRCSWVSSVIEFYCDFCPNTEFFHYRPSLQNSIQIRLQLCHQRPYISHEIIIYLSLPSLITSRSSIKNSRYFSLSPCLAPNSIPVVYFHGLFFLDSELKREFFSPRECVPPGGCTWRSTGDVSGTTGGSSTLLNWASVQWFVWLAIPINLKGVSAPFVPALCGLPTELFEQ